MKKFLALVLATVSLSCLASCNKDSGSKEIKPTSIELSFTSKTMSVGEEAQLVATVKPENATNKQVSYTVSDSSIASVNQAGLITTYKEGTAEVTVTCVGAPNVKNTATITVVNAVAVTGVKLNKTTTDILVGNKETLVATVSPTNATNKKVTWSSNNKAVATVDETTGEVTGVSRGSAKITATTEDGNKTSSCTVRVIDTEIDGYVVDEKGLISKVEQKLDGGQLVELKPTTDTIPYYTFNYGAEITFTFENKGYFEVTGLTIDDEFKAVKNMKVTFFATIEDPLEESTFFMDIRVKYEDKTPVVGEYTFSITNSEHLTVTVVDKTGKELNSCNLNDQIVINIKTSDDDYGLKTLKVTHTTSDIGSPDDVNTSYSETYGGYLLTVPFCYSKVLTIVVTEKNLSAFKGSPLVGTYNCTRTYGISVGSSQSYITKFETTQLTFDASGEIIYGSNDPVYATKAENGIITAKYGNSDVSLYYDENIIILGKASNGGNIITPFDKNSNSTDIIIAVKQKEDTLAKDYTICGEIFATGNNANCLYQVYYADKVYVSFYCVANLYKYYFGVDTVMHKGEQFTDAQAVYDIVKNDETLLSVGYIDEGTYKNRVALTDVKNGYKNLEHTLIFINTEEVLYDDVMFKYSFNTETGNLELLNPTLKVIVTLNSDEMTFVEVSREEIVAKKLDIANKVFTGKYDNSWDDCKVNATITFGSSNDNITGTVLSNDYFKYYWTFTGVFDSSTNILTITVVDRGYGGKTSNFDSSIGKQVPLLLEEGKLTFKDQLSTQTNVYSFKNKVFTCSDFHI